MQPNSKKKVYYTIFAVIVILILFKIIILLSNKETTTNNLIVNDTLVLVQVLFRHGERTPDSYSVYPKDPYKNESYYEPYGFGQLRNKGKKTVFLLGEVLKNRYGTFLGPYKYNKLRAKASIVMRARVSLQILLAALFKPISSFERWNDELDWQPINFDVNPQNDLIFMYFMNCPINLQTWEKQLEDDLINGRFGNIQWLVEKVKENTGYTNFYKIIHVYNYLQEQFDFGLQLPAWTKDIFPVPLKTFTETGFYLVATNEKFKTTSGGFILRDMIQNIDDKINGINNGATLKIALYSGHDLTITNLFGTLNILEKHLVPYGAMVALELHKIEEKYFVEVLYQKGPINKLVRMKLPGCNMPCPYEEFCNMYSKYLPSNETCASNSQCTSGK